MSTSNKKIFCFIPAKAASTRLKKKNILKLDGKELIYYPIRNAINSGIFQEADIILSTESEEIKTIAEKYGANVPYLREEKLARDPYGVVDVLLDFLNRFPTYKTYDSVCILLPTAPLMAKEDLIGAWENFSSGAFDVLMSVTESEHSAYRAISVDVDGKVKPIFNEFINKKSQELEKTFRINGALIMIKINELIKSKTYFLSNWGAYVMPTERSVDIDNQEGFDYAKFLLSAKGINAKA